MDDGGKVRPYKALYKGTLNIEFSVKCESVCEVKGIRTSLITPFWALIAKKMFKWLEEVRCCFEAG